METIILHISIVLFIVGMIDLILFDSDIVTNIFYRIDIDGTIHTRNKINLFLARKNIAIDKIAKLLEIIILVLLVYIYYCCKK